ncbi:MAG: hypothetical protein KDH19_21045, partial [Geminicoccaceae bacterium]|nr:hypothetical protein [Geminicoccaceae bacterium]
MMNVMSPSGNVAADRGYRVDTGRGERVGRVSSEWFRRPDDERFSSLDALMASVRQRSERSHTRILESAAVRVEARRAQVAEGGSAHESAQVAEGGSAHESDNDENLSLQLPGEDRPVAPTHWSFGQLASLAGAPSGYLRQLP